MQSNCIYDKSWDRWHEIELEAHDQCLSFCPGSFFFFYPEHHLRCYFWPLQSNISPSPLSPLSLCLSHFFFLSFPSRSSEWLNSIFTLTKTSYTETLSLTLSLWCGLNFNHKEFLAPIYSGLVSHSFSRTEPREAGGEASVGAEEYWQCSVGKWFSVSLHALLVS